MLPRNTSCGWRDPPERFGVRIPRGDREQRRCINTEWKAGPNFYANGSDLWVFGYKVEGPRTNFVALRGGRLEVLGGVTNQYAIRGPTPDPVVLNDHAHVCYVGCTNGPDADVGFTTIIEERRGQRTYKLNWQDLPPRQGRRHQVVVPMYAGYEPAAAPE